MRSDRRSDSGSEIGSSAVRDDHGGSSREDLNLRAVGVVLAAVVVALDQLTKWWAETALSNAPIAIIEGIVQFRLTFNTGASFSLFAGSGPIIGVVAFGIVGFILYILGDASRRIEAVALGLVLGGAVGNLVDRVSRGPGLLDGAVVDFIDLSFFATFNVADIAITLGVGLLIVAAFWKRA